MILPPPYPLTSTRLFPCPSFYLFILSMSSASNDVLQEKMLSQSAWKDYSTNGHHHTNYAYEHFDPSAVADAEMKQSKASNGHSAHPGRYAASNGSSSANGRSRGGPPPMGPQSMQPGHNGPGSTYSLPRVAGNGAGYTTSPMGANGAYPPPPPPGGGGGGYPPHPSAYGSYDRRLPHGGYGGHQQPRSDYAPPDHYFMPSQRKYSGENIRVYVDYNK